jgi:hypothetical protein
VFGSPGQPSISHLNREFYNFSCLVARLSHSSTAQLGRKSPLSPARQRSSIRASQVGRAELVRNPPPRVWGPPVLPRGSNHPTLISPLSHSPIRAPPTPPAFASTVDAGLRFQRRRRPKLPQRRPLTPPPRLVRERPKVVPT